MTVLILAIACTAELSAQIRRPRADADSASPPDGDTADTAPDDTAPDDGDDDTADSPNGPCAAYMVAVADAFCIDQYEASLEEWLDGDWVAASPYMVVDGRTVRAAVAPGQVPQGYISGEEARSACEASGKRLCSSEEWLLACQGPDTTTWPYGDTYEIGACNDTYEGSHPVVDYFGTSDGVWDGEHMNDPGINQQPSTVAVGGEFGECVSAWGAYDLHGNLHEWVDDPNGTFRGGFYADGSINGAGCTYTTTAHSIGYHDYSTGFRCCSDPL